MFLLVCCGFMVLMLFGLKLYLIGLMFELLCGMMRGLLFLWLGRCGCMGIGWWMMLLLLLIILEFELEVEELECFIECGWLVEGVEGVVGVGCCILVIIMLWLFGVVCCMWKCISCWWWIYWVDIYWVGVVVKGVGSGDCWEGMVGKRVLGEVGDDGICIWGWRGGRYEGEDFGKKVWWWIIVVLGGVSDLIRWWWFWVCGV